MKNSLFFWISRVLLLTFPLSGFAFDNGPTWFGFSHTPNISGARTIGMGGTAVASVDDASATLANPAALVRLTKTEFRLDGNFRHIEARNHPGADNLGTGESISLGLHVDETNQIDPAFQPHHPAQQPGPPTHPPITPTHTHPHTQPQLPSPAWRPGWSVQSSSSAPICAASSRR